MTTKTLRDQIRAATLGEKSEFKNEIVTYNGVKVELRQPTVKVRKDLMDKSMNEDGKINVLMFMTYGVIYNTYIPDTNELVYEETDFDAMMDKPVGCFLDSFGEKISNLLNIEDDGGVKND
ncbi:hypothetical protein KAR91_20530 [Candidatus Pacearchaeota archaeon]|nr:hypothetical protein [Candidatus Pacearchaeota archaeon]